MFRYFYQTQQIPKDGVPKHFRYTVRLVLFSSVNYSGGTTVIRKWSGLRFKLFVKYRPFFRFWAARVLMDNYPQLVELHVSREIVTGSTPDQIEGTRERLRISRMLLARYQKRLKSYLAGQSNLFGEDSDARVVKAKAKIEAKKIEVAELEKELSVLERYKKVEVQ